MKLVRGVLGILLAAGVTLGSTGCLKSVLLKGQIKGTRQASAAVNTLQDYGVAKAAAMAGMAQLEGMHWLAPGNPDALFMLARGWGGVAFGFIEDEYEQSYEAGDDLMAEYNRARARAGFERATFYGIELLKATADGFEDATTNADTMRDWLTEHFTEPEHAEELLWVGYAWIGRVSVSKDVPELVGELYVGVEMIRRSVELDRTAINAMGLTILGAYHSRTAMAELDESKKMFDQALAINEGNFLPTKLALATRYYCVKGDKENYYKILNEILAVPDPLPTSRLQNLIAKRRARRYIANPIWQESCGFGA